MRIALDLSAVRTPGTFVYLEGFLPAISRLLNSEDQLVVFGPSSLRQQIVTLAGRNTIFLANSAAAIVPARICWQQLILPRVLSQLKADVLFEPYDMGPLYSACPMVLGIRNPTPVILAEGTLKLSWRGSLQRHIHQWLVRRSSRRAQSLLFPSRYASERVGGLLGAPAGKRKVVFHGLDVEFWSDSNNTQNAPEETRRPQYILFASKFYQQKRAPLMLEAFQAWRQSHDTKDTQLLFCGEDRDSPVAKAMLRRIAELGLEAEVRLLGVVDRPVLRDLYRRASICVQPTVMETFGFPYVEAMASGRPLVCADIEIARELCGEAAYYFRPDDRDDLVAALENASHDTPARSRKLAEGSERARSFSWRREAEETLACLRAAAADSPKGAAGGFASPGRDREAEPVINKA